MGEAAKSMGDILAAKSVQVAFVTGGALVTAFSIANLKPPEMLWFAGIGLTLMVVPPIIIAVWNYRHRYDDIEHFKRFREMNEEVDSGRRRGQTSPSFLSEFQSPTVESDIRVTGNLLVGHKLIVKLEVRNNDSSILGGASAIVKVSDMHGNKPKLGEFHLPDLLPKETGKSVLRLSLGRRLSPVYKIALMIARHDYSIKRNHFTLAESTGEGYRVASEGDAKSV